MKIKHSSWFLSGLLLLQLSFIQSASALEPCQLEKTDFGYIILNDDCFLSAPPLEVKGGIKFYPYPNDQNLADLVPIDADVQHANNQFYVSIKTANIGVADSNGFEITVTAITNGSVTETHVISARVNGIRAGDERRDHIGIIYPDDLLELGDTILLVMQVDTAGSPFFGDVAESNEANNTVTDLCWLGENGECDEF